MEPPLQVNLVSNFAPSVMSALARVNVPLLPPPLPLEPAAPAVPTVPAVPADELPPAPEAAVEPPELPS